MNSRIFDVDLITSKSNSTIVKIGKLQQKKARKDEQLFTLDGVKLFQEAYSFGAEIKYIILKDSSAFDEKVLDKIRELQQRKVQVLCVNDVVFEKLTEESAPQGIITVCKFLDIHNYIDFSQGKKGERVMMLESIRDPGNFGSILRNAAAFGVDRIICSADCVDIYSQKVIRASMGAIFKVNVDIVDNMVQTVEELKNSGRRVIATTLGENSLILGVSQIEKTDVFIVGNEGHGVSDSLIEKANETMFIPMCQNTESLNASVASAILMWELFNI